MQGDPLQFTHIARCRTISGRITRFEIKENIMRHLTMLIRLAIFAESYRYYISNLYVRLLLHLAPQCLYQRFLAKLHATARNVPRVRVRPHTLRRFAHENLAVKLGGSAALTQSRIKASERSFSAVADNGDPHRKEFGYGKQKRLKFRYDKSTKQAPLPSTAYKQPRGFALPPLLPIEPFNTVELKLVQ